MSAKRSASRVSESTPPQQKRAQWSNQAYTVEELLEQFSLPQIVKCNPQAILVKKDAPLPVNLGQPLLLFDSRTVRKLLARNVILDPTTGKFTENDDTVVIPNDYDGAFLRLMSRTSKDHTSHKTIDSMAMKNIKAFLNLTKLTAFRVVNSPNGIGDFPRVDYIPGNVFVIDEIFAGNVKLKNDGKFHQHKNGSSQHSRYAKCRDEKDNSIIIPVSLTGEFVEILPNDLNGSGRMSVRSSDLIEKQKFPIIVRYIRGRFKPRLTSFTGLFTLLDSYEETTIVGCVLDKSGYTLIELPMSSPLTFHLALNFSELQTHPVVKNGLRLCDNTSQNFARDLKFKFKFAQRYLQMGNKQAPIDDGDDPGESPSARNTAKMGVSTTYIYI
ncbi:hypothetical protein ACF0H5_004376 [Mactra antiquata]